MRRKTTRRVFLSTLASSGLLVACGGGNTPPPTTTPAPTTTTPPPTTTAPPPTTTAPPPTTTPPPTTAAPKMPLTIDVTQANLPTNPPTPLYAYIIGGVVTAPTPAATPIENYWLDASGKVNVMKVTDNTEAAGSFPGMTSTDAQTCYPSMWANYSIPLSQTTPTVIDLANINSANMPGLGVGTNAFSGRVYISVGNPILPFTVQSQNSTSPNPYAGPSESVGAPGSLCIFDWFEFSLDINGILNGNSTYVNSFALPLSITVTPGSSTPQGALNVTRLAVMNAINQFPAPLGGGVLLQAVPAADASLYPAGIAYLRAISPDTLSGNGNGSASFNTYFDAVIQAAYTTWAGTPIVVTGVATNATSSGMVVNNELIFIPGSYTDSASWNAQYAVTPASQQINFGLITTAMIWQCDGTLTTGSAVQLSIGKQLLAAFNRGVAVTVVNNQFQGITSLNDGACPTVNPTTQAPYYPANVPSNFWSYQFHLWNKNNLAYGFAYDDVCSQNPSFNTSSALQSLNITLGAMQ